MEEKKKRLELGLDWRRLTFTMDFDHILLHSFTTALPTVRTLQGRDDELLHTHRTEGMSTLPEDEGLLLITEGVSTST